MDSAARRADYLSKVLALDPTHERARADLGARPTEDAPQPVTEFTPPATEAVAVAPESAPEWLQPLSPEPAPVAEAVTPLPVVAAPTPARPRPTPPPPPPPRQQGNSALTALLVLLALLTLAVLAILAYLLLF